ncbi:hypothetical protein A3F66_01490 [candidate division TM6 bacterium RIFCSPHIGHO2_12_FULL_32_22]|nr:MAG: hypothetical protein A3F66_01490 [candidate division TM6 bacterium RIFCSPHIGHO2_12_FULL_32_22]
MNLKDLLVPLLIGTLFAITIRYFFMKDADISQAERSRVAPAKEEINRPLEFDVDFVDSDFNKVAKQEDVETKFAKLTFSEAGATLIKAYFKHDVGNNIQLLQTITDEGKENQCFLLALQGSTPLLYRLTNRFEDDENIILQYESTSKDKTISKQFKIYKNIPKLDLQINLKTKNEERLRLFFNSPLLDGLKDDKIQGIVNDGKYLVKRNIDIAKEGRYWDQPTLFGSEDRYFVNVMIADQNKFTQRAYYKVDDKGLSLISILESAKIASDSSWVMSFYFGPKKAELMQSVDPRLSGTLEFGMWEIICLPMLKLLNFFHSYAKNYGIAIILLTILIKLLLFPFTWRGQKNLNAMSKKQKEFQQKMEYLKQKHKGNTEEFRREQAELLRTHALPGIGGCLGLLLQIPVFFALQRVLSNAIELYKAPFLWIPNLSMPDPYYIFPILVGIGMIWSGFGSSSSLKKIDPKQKLMSYSMALVFTAITFSLSSGLVLYLVVNTLLMVIQNFLQNRFIKA